MPDNVEIRRLASREALMRRMRAGDSYSVLLAAIIFAYGTMAVLDTTQWHRTIEGAIFGGVLLLALHTSHVRGRWIRFATVIIVLWILFNVAQSIMGELFVGSGYAMSSIIVLTPLVVLNRILRHPRVNLETILGAICAYMLIGIAFATIYAMMDRLGGTAFFAQEQTHDPVKFLYFSFIVLTTVGFGDLSPATDSGRIIVSMEALVGQIFLVTLVAGLVGNIGRARTQTVERSFASPDDVPVGETDERDDDERAP